MSCYLVQEIDGVSRFTLEDGSGSLLLEFCPPVTPGGDVSGGPSYWSRRKRRQQMLSEEEDLMTVLLNGL